MTKATTGLRRILVAAALLIAGAYGTASACMSSEHFGHLVWEFKRVSGSSGLKVQAAIAC